MYKASSSDGHAKCFDSNKTMPLKITAKKLLQGILKYRKELAV